MNLLRALQVLEDVLEETPTPPNLGLVDSTHLKIYPGVREVRNWCPNYCQHWRQLTHLDMNKGKEFVIWATMTLSLTHRDAQETVPLGARTFKADQKSQMPSYLPLRWMPHSHRLTPTRHADTRGLCLSFSHSYSICSSLTQTHLKAQIFLNQYCYSLNLPCSMRPPTCMCAVPFQSSLHVFQLCFCTYCRIS